MSPGLEYFYGHLPIESSDETRPAYYSCCSFDSWKCLFNSYRYYFYQRRHSYNDGDRQSCSDVPALGLQGRQHQVGPELHQGHRPYGGGL